MNGPTCTVTVTNHEPIPVRLDCSRSREPILTLLPHECRTIPIEYASMVATPAGGKEETPQCVTVDMGGDTIKIHNPGTAAVHVECANTLLVVEPGKSITWRDRDDHGQS